MADIELSKDAKILCKDYTMEAFTVQDNGVNYDFVRYSDEDNWYYEDEYGTTHEVDNKEQNKQLNQMAEDFVSRTP